MVRTCIICGTEKPIEEFAVRRYVDGLPVYRSECRNCSNAVKREAYNKRVEFLNTYKKKCRKCGNTKFYLLEFHNRNASELDKPTGFWTGGSIDKVMEEIEQCDTLCSNCHAAFHYLEKEYNITYDFYLENDCSNYQ